MIAEPFNHMIELMFGPLEGSINDATPAGLLVLGLIMGLRHSLEADHLAAVSTIIATNKRNRFRAPMLGALWGIGHTTSLLIAGAIVLLLAVNIPERVSGMLEFGVGIMLVLLAVQALTGFKVGRFLRGIVRHERHAHLHIHEDVGIAHTHDHDHEQDHEHGHKSLIVGMVHGIAGSGALMLAVLSTIHSVPLGLAYIAIFGAGSIASMAAMSTLIGLPIAKARNRKVNLALKYVSSAIALVIGIGLIYNLGVVERVFVQ
ncbi:MAG: urease accessory protein UreH [Thermoproteota archaeon]